MERLRLAPGVFVIGHFLPDVIVADDAGPALLEITKKLKFTRDKKAGAWFEATWFNQKLSAELRDPSVHKSVVANGRAIKWHQDGGAHSKVAMIIWSNREQTEIMTEHAVIIPHPGDILIVKNNMVQHRTPPVVSEDRWFFRRYVKSPRWLK